MQKRPAGLRERRQSPNEGPVRYFRSLIGTALAATALSCTPAKLVQEAPPKNPDNVHSEVTEESKEKEPVVAPPPTYGNKIVQAEDGPETRNL